VYTSMIGHKILLQNEGKDSLPFLGISVPKSEDVPLMTSISAGKHHANEVDKEDVGWR
jgi:hypothetical protein